jgi:hypothetical protein
MAGLVLVALLALLVLFLILAVGDFVLAMRWILSPAVVITLALVVANGISISVDGCWQTRNDWLPRFGILDI